MSLLSKNSQSVGVARELCSLATPTEERSVWILFFAAKPQKTISRQVQGCALNRFHLFFCAACARQKTHAATCHSFGVGFVGFSTKSKNPQTHTRESTEHFLAGWGMEKWLEPSSYAPTVFQRSPTYGTINFVAKYAQGVLQRPEIDNR